MRKALIAASFFVATAAQAQTRPSPPPFKAPPLALGTSWYPEQWPEDQWDRDLASMARAHLSVVRIGEFAWARMEPRDGAFDFTWLDRAVAAAALHGLRVVLGTPSAAPPIWLTEAHPDVLRVDADGSVASHGSRRQFSFASATYRRYAARIAAEMARRYGKNPAVVGWQIDNEIGVPSFDREARSLWAAWLRARYGSIGELNRRWSTQYWSQHYERFEQVQLKWSGPENPALLLDARRFASDTWADYVARQVLAIRAHADARQFVTTNSTAWNDNFDQYRVHREIDMAAWDDYVPDGRPDWAANALHHDLVRGYKRRNFWMMETQPGRVDWAAVTRSLDPGQTRELAWQAIAHGADAILYWQWRSAPGGQEQYHGTLVGPDGEPQPIYREIARTAREMSDLSALLGGTQPNHARVAMIYAQDGRWAIEQQRHTRDYDPVAVMKDWYRPLAGLGMAVDVLSPDADLSSYGLVVAPQLNVLSAATAERLGAYVRGGGTLLLGPRSGMKDGDNAIWPQRQPGPLASMLGASVAEYYALDEAIPLADGEGAARIWAEAFSVQADTEVISRYGSSEGWLANAPAMVAHRAGRGTIAYLGAVLDDRGQAAATRWAIARAGIPVSPRVSDDPDVESATRCDLQRCYRIVINHGPRTATLTFPAGARPIGGELRGALLPPHGVAVLSIDGGGAE